ncbi:MAG: hypothetical protein U0R28_05295 [Candidatus Nanopelagicales bacterium]
MQILLDHDRYERLEKEATRRRQSVGATVRDAIDLLLDEDATRRLAARRALLRMRTSAMSETEFDKDAMLKDALK